MHSNNIDGYKELYDDSERNQIPIASSEYDDSFMTYLAISMARKRRRRPFKSKKSIQLDILNMQANALSASISLVKRKYDSDLVPYVEGRAQHNDENDDDGESNHDCYYDRNSTMRSSSPQATTTNTNKRMPHLKLKHVYSKRTNYPKDRQARMATTISKVRRDGHISVLHVTPKTMSMALSSTVTTRTSETTELVELKFPLRNKTSTSALPVPLTIPAAMPVPATLQDLVARRSASKRVSLNLPIQQPSPRRPLNLPSLHMSLSSFENENTMPASADMSVTSFESLRTISTLSVSSYGTSRTSSTMSSLSSFETRKSIDSIQSHNIKSTVDKYTTLKTAETLCQLHMNEKKKHHALESAIKKVQHLQKYPYRSYPSLTKNRSIRLNINNTKQNKYRKSKLERIESNEELGFRRIA